MPVHYYLIPMVDPPYSRQNPCRPKYVQELRANWTGHDVPFKGIYICKVNTTDAKHDLLIANADVLQVPNNIMQVDIGNLPAAARNKIHNVLNLLDLPYYEDENLRHCLQRIIVSGLFQLPNVSRDTLLRDLPPAVQQRGAAFLDKWNIPYSGDDTLIEVLKRCRDLFWNPDDQYVEEY